jgi:hypothetical protein
MLGDIAVLLEEEGADCVNDPGTLSAAERQGEGLGLVGLLDAGPIEVSVRAN